jgi:S1-C subfamily serine protease
MGMSRKRRDGGERDRPSVPESGRGREARRELFARVRRSVLAIVIAPDSLDQLLEKSAAEAFAAVTVIGTGFVVDDSGTALTTRHVVQPWLEAAHAHQQRGGPLPPPPKIAISTPVQPTASGQAHWGFRIGIVSAIQSSETDDVAAIHFDPPPGQRLSSLALAEEPCEDGDEVVVCGFPFGRELPQDRSLGAVLVPAFAQGIVSGALAFPGEPAGRVGFQLDARVSGGGSGGPVVDIASGKVVGIVTDPGNRTPEGPARGPSGRGKESGSGGEFARAIYAHRAFSVIGDLRQTLAGQQAGAEPGRSGQRS